MALTLDGTKGETFPTWTTAGRPASPSQGQVGFNTSLSVLEAYDGTNWEPLGLVSATAQNSTSGTYIDFTGIPAGVKRITVMLSGVSTSGTSGLLVQIGSGSITNTGYVYTGNYFNTGPGSTASTAGFLIFPVVTAAGVAYGHNLITSLGSNIWVASNTMIGGSTQVSLGGGGVTLSGTLDRVRVTTVNGTDTFDAGSINIMYE